MANVSPASLYTLLLNTNLQTRDTNTYQVIKNIIDGLVALNTQINSSSSSSGSGTVGPIGPTGAQGVQGLSGNDGLDGNEGLDGQIGYTGPIGPRGLDGISGFDGNDGRDGFDGIPGARGLQGIQGFNGLDGLDGDDFSLSLPIATLDTIVGILPTTKGGTGLATYAVGDLLYYAAGTALSKLADVSAGSYLRSGGVVTAPLWSTLKLPNSATLGQVIYASATDTWAGDSGITIDGTNHTLTIASVAGNNLTLSKGNNSPVLQFNGTASNNQTISMVSDVLTFTKTDGLTGTLSITQGGLVTIPGNFTVTGTQIFTGATTHIAKIATYNNIATAGWGVEAVSAIGRNTGITVATSGFGAYTPAVDGSFIISANVLVTTSTLHNFTVRCFFTDESNIARTLTLTFSQVAGTLVTAITNVTGAGVYVGVSFHIRARGGSVINFDTTGTFTTVTYNLDTRITQVS